MVILKMNKRHTKNISEAIQEKNKYHHISTYMCQCICLYEQNWRLWQCHGGYLHQLGFHVCFISATGSHLRCLRLEKPIPLHIYIYIRPICLGYIREYPPQTTSFFWAKKGYWNSQLICPCCVRVASGEWLLWWFDGRFCRDLEAWRFAQWIGWSWVNKLVYNSYNS